MRFPRSTARLGARTNTGIAGQVHRNPNYGTQCEARRAFLECDEPLVHPRGPLVRLQSRFSRFSQSRTSGPSDGMMKATGVIARVFAGALALRRSQDACLFQSDFAECHHKHCKSATSLLGVKRGVAHVSVARAKEPWTTNHGGNVP